MTDLYAEVAFVLLVAGAAMIWPPLALIVAAGFFIGLVIHQARKGE